MIREDLQQLLTEAIDRAVARGDLPAVGRPEIVLERPPNPEHGDFASPIALKMARGAGKPPLEVAGAITANLRPTDAVAAVETARPGFINFYLASAWLQRQVETVLEAGPRFGAASLGDGQRVQVEYVSANPTGPLHVGAGRNAALGDTLANLLEYCGYDVEREYYVNNAGSRIDALARSVYYRYCQLRGKDVEEPADGYPGEYVVEIAQRIVDEHGDRFMSLPEEQALPELGKLSVEIVIGWIRDDLAAINVHFDRWYYEQDLYDSGLFDRAMALLREQGHVAEREGAVWFTTTDLGDDKDNVLVRSNGAPTYFASDVAYHYDKFLLRGFDRVINVWAADHQGHVPRMKALAKALGIDPDRLTVALYQLVRLMKDGKPVRQGKRTGTFVALSEALEEIGPDALRFFLVAYSSNAPMDLDLDLARKEASENPVYYVQYGHARIASLLRRAEDLDYRAGKVGLLNDPTELALIRKMLMLPELVQTATEQLAPHHLPYYAVDLAKAFTAFYESCRVLGNEDQELTLARLKLSAACKQVLANALRLIGVSAPERMSREDS